MKTTNSNDKIYNSYIGNSTYGLEFKASPGNSFLNEKYIFTSSGEPFVDKYFSLPSNINILSRVENLQELHEESVKRQVTFFISRLYSILLSYKTFYKEITDLPELMLTIDQVDSSVLIEWIFKDFRFGFSFERNKSDSSWYFVSNDKFDSLNTSGKISENGLDDLLINTLNFVISHV